jgi:adenine-specific DNA methylase
MPDEDLATRPRLLIEDWLPAAAIGVECIRERSTGQQPPDKRLHIWWARRPLVASRAAVLASVLPAQFPRDVFERLLGFGRPGHELVAIRQLMDTGVRVEGGFGVPRAFKGALRNADVAQAHAATAKVWGHLPTVLDPMAGGGSIPLESARLGFPTLANEYNPVACSVLEATIDYPFRLGARLAERARHWGRIWETRVAERLGRFFPKDRGGLVHAYIFARTVPCPSTGHMTPLVPDWHLLKPKGGVPIVAVPKADKKTGTWTVEIKSVGEQPGQTKEVPRRTYSHGKGESVFTDPRREAIPTEWIKAKAQAGEMRSALYAVALKTPKGLKFRTPTADDLDAIAAAEEQLHQVRSDWQARNLIPIEEYPLVTTDPRPRVYGMPYWADMFSPRQLLGFGVQVEELQALRPRIIADEGQEIGEAVIHMLAFAIDKFTNYNNYLASWHVKHQVVRGIFDRHDFSFKPTFTEMAPTGAGSGLAWAVTNTIEAYEDIEELPHDGEQVPIETMQGSATSLIQLEDHSLDAVVVDPPYAANVQYSELADFFYVWLKRTQGHRRPEWFSSALCDHDLEAVENVAWFRTKGLMAKEAKAKAQAHYERLMTETFTEARRVLRPDGVLTVMFTHKKQEAWESLFSSLIEAGFTISATWPVKTESEHSLHQAKKNAAQSTVILVARVRPPNAGIGYFDHGMQARIREVAEETAERLEREGLNPVDQLVGTFGPAMSVFSAFDEMRTDKGEPIRVGAAIEIASDAVANWRIRKLAASGLQGVEPEAQFALLCWDTLRAAEFRFNEAKLLGHAVGMDVSALEIAGLIAVKQDQVKMLSASERRREAPLTNDQAQQLLFGFVHGSGKKVKKTDALKIHPRDPAFRTHVDKAQALALAYADAGGGAAGIGAAKSFALRHSIKAGDATVSLIEALLKAAPPAVRRDEGEIAAKFAEFRALHAMLEPLFSIAPPDWTEKPPDQGMLQFLAHPGDPADGGEEVELNEVDSEDDDDEPEQ